MNRISVFVRRQRIKKLETWIMRTILLEAFFLALAPSVAAAAVLVGILAWFFRLQIDSRFKLRGLPLDVPVVIFVLFGAVSVFLSPARNFELIYNFCGIVGIYILTYILVGQNIRTQEQMLKVAKALTLSAFIVVMYGFFQYIFGVDISEMKWVDGEAFPELRKRIFSTLENPNVLAGYLDVMICLALGLFMKIQGSTQKIILAVVIGLLTACLAMTYSRGAFLAIAIVFVICGIIKDRRLLILFLILTGAIIYTDSTFLHRVLSIFTEATDSSEGLRVGIWVSTIAMIADHPFVGIGWGAFKFVYPQYNYYLQDTTQTIYLAHNLFLQTAAEVGIVGALAYFWYFFGTMFQSITFDTAEKYSQLKRDAKNFATNAKPSFFKEKLVEVILTSKFLQTLANSKSLMMDRTAEVVNKIMDWFSFTPSEKDLRKSGKRDEDFSDEDLGEDSEKIFSAIEIKNSAQEKNISEVEDEKISDEEKISDTAEKISEPELVHHEELKWSAPPISRVERKKNSAEKISGEEKNISEPEDKNFSDAKKISAEKNDNDKMDLQRFAARKLELFPRKISILRLTEDELVDGLRVGIGLAFLSMALNGMSDDLLFNIPSSILMWLLGALSAAIKLEQQSED